MIKRILLLLFILAYSFVSLAQRTDTVKVKVHNHEIVLYVSGRGNPTVVPEAGGGGNHRNWEKVQPGIAAFTYKGGVLRPARNISL